MGLVHWKSLFALVLTLLSDRPFAFGQSAEELLRAGRRLLAKGEWKGARDSMAAAVALTPDDKVANVLLGVTRTLCLVEEPTGKFVFAQFGMGLWNGPRCATSVDQLGAVVAQLPPDQPMSFARPVLDDVSVCAANLDHIDDPNFVLLLNSNETASVDVLIDNADICMLRAGLELGKYVCYSAWGRKGEERMMTLRSMASGAPNRGAWGASDLVSLRDLASASDRKAAALALSNGIALYLIASALISGRRTNDIHLFNYDPRTADAEIRFRDRLKSLRKIIDDAKRG